jgi:hypothetical protein
MRCGVIHVNMKSSCIRLIYYNHVTARIVFCLDFIFLTYPVDYSLC